MLVYNLEKQKLETFIKNDYRTRLAKFFPDDKKIISILTYTY